MNRIIYVSAVLTLLVFSGCTSKEPAIDATANTGMSSGGASQSSVSHDVSGDNTAVISPITSASASDTNSNGSNSGNSADAQGIQSILFDYDKFDIREDMQGKLKVNASLLKNKAVKLEGNCDEFGSDEYNFALGLKRANGVKAALVNEGVNADSISMTSLGESNPVCLDKTQECWAKNRRVDFKLP